jgi:hypothetical protein
MSKFFTAYPHNFWAKLNGKRLSYFFLEIVKKAYYTLDSPC